MVQRIQGLRLVDQGMSERSASQFLGVGRRTLQDWISKYRRGGVGVRVKGPYSGRKPKLNAEEYIWKETRKLASHNRFFGTPKDLKDGLFCRFNRFQDNTGILRSIVAHFA